MLKRKRREVGDKAGKLKGGLQKLQETGVQVAEMQVGTAQAPCISVLPSPAFSMQAPVDMHILTSRAHAVFCMLPQIDLCEMVFESADCVPRQEGSGSRGQGQL